MSWEYVPYTMMPYHGKRYLTLRSQITGKGTLYMYYKTTLWEELPFTANPQHRKMYLILRSHTTRKGTLNYEATPDHVHQNNDSDHAHHKDNAQPQRQPRPPR